MTPVAARPGLLRRQLGYQRRRALRAARLVADHDVVPSNQLRLRSLLLRAQARWSYLLVKGMHDPWSPVDVASFMGETPWKVARDGTKYATVQLILADLERHHVPGSLVEIGVCTGDFAALLSRWLPDARMLLFDTFEGFDPRDLALEQAGAAAPYTLPETTPELVRSRLCNPERAEIRVGRFPDTVGGLDGEVIRLAHVDTGVYAPTLAGLRWCWPRLSAGGCLLVSDYGNRHAPGSRRAVDEFLGETAVGAVPLPDVAATVVLSKPLSAAGAR